MRSSGPHCLFLKPAVSSASHSPTPKAISGDKATTAYTQEMRNGPGLIPSLCPDFLPPPGLFGLAS